VRAACGLLASAFALCGCSQNAAIDACESFIKERLRSPSTYRQVAAEYSGVTFRNEGRNVLMATVEYDAANAFGTPIRGSQQCVFEVDRRGNFLDNPEHAAQMAAIGAPAEFAPCCIIERNGSAPDNAEQAAEEAMRAADDALNASDEAMKAAAAQSPLVNGRN
jgi:hypothetical protein